jgi:hypothetical protein
MAGQYRRLLDLARLPTVTVQVVPYTEPVAAAFPAPFVLLDYARPAGDAGIAYLRHLTRTEFIDDPDEIADYREVWRRLTTAALSPAASVELIAALTREVRP